MHIQSNYGLHGCCCQLLSTIRVERYCPFKLIFYYIQYVLTIRFHRYCSPYFLINIHTNTPNVTVIQIARNPQKRISHSVFTMMFLFIGRRCAKTVINIINSLPYKCANGPFINKALTTVYYTKLAAVSLRCLEKKQQQIKSKNIKMLHKNPTKLIYFAIRSHSIHRKKQ